VADEPFLQEINHRLIPGFERPAIAVLPGPIVVEPRAIRSETEVLLELGPSDGELIAAVATEGAIYAASRERLWRFDGAWTSIAGAWRTLVAGRRHALAIADEGLYSIDDAVPLAVGRSIPGVLTACESARGLFVATSSAVIEIEASEIDRAALPASIGRPVALLAGVMFRLVVVGELGIAAFDGTPLARVDVPIFAPDRVPYVGARGAIALRDGGFAVATNEGAMRLLDRGSGLEWRVYNADRWIPSKDVRGLAQDDRLWLATAAGVAAVETRSMTLEEKMQGFVERIVLRHDRDGAVADSHLLRRGELDSNVPWDSDNDGSWTSYWLRAECRRFRVTGDPAAELHFDESLDAMLRLRDLTGTDHFVARAVIRKATCNLDDCDDPDDGEWFTSPDGEWWVKGDTSNDEVIAHIGMMGEAYDLCADEAQRERIRKHIAGIIGGIADHGWQLVDLDGAVTTYGQFDPHYVQETLPGIVGDGGLRAAQILAGLTLAHYLTGESRFAEAKDLLIREHGYDQEVLNELERGARRAHMDNDEMAVWAFNVLLRYEPDPDRYALWRESWEHEWEAKFDDEQAAWWDVVHGMNGGAIDPERIRRWLQLAPVDMIRWNVDNSGRRDLVRAPKTYFTSEGRMRSDGKIVPYDERPTNRWNTDSFHVDGGLDGWIEMDGADALAPYWIARDYGWIAMD
jgi:hypothetical protein